MKRVVLKKVIKNKAVIATAITAFLFVFSVFIGQAIASDTYTITASSGDNGNISPAGVATVSGGSDQTYAITPDPGYRVAGLKIDNFNVDGVSSYTFKDIAMNHTISATFEPDVYTIEASAGTNGSISPSGTSTVNGGSNQTFTATPDAGYRVASMTVDGSSIGAKTSYTFSNISMNHTISVAFEADVYTITASAEANGSITPSGDTTVSGGSNQTYTITPDDGYRVAKLDIDGFDVDALTSYTFENVTMNHTISVIFEKNVYSIIASAGDNGSVSPLGETTVNGGDDKAFTATPDAGYRVSSMTVDGSNIGAKTSYTFSNISMNHTISVAFTINTYTITASAGANGSISPSGNVTVNGGSIRSFTATPATGYRVASFVIDGTTVTGITSYTFSNINMNHSISATFAINTYKITATAGTGGAFSPAGTITKNGGSSQAFTATPNTGYRVASMTVDGSNIGAQTSYTFNNINMNHTISVTFTINTYTITASAGTGGIISPSGNKVLNSGSNQIYTITASQGYRIANVVVDGFNLGARSNWTFSNITRNHTISATFTQ